MAHTFVGFKASVLVLVIASGELNEYTNSISRSTADSEKFVAESRDIENVELEKSNVLLMGPTGSGILPAFLF